MYGIKWKHYENFHIELSLWQWEEVFACPKSLEQSFRTKPYLN
jgi:hypothetical protein